MVAVVQREADVQRACIQWLTIQERQGKLIWWRSNNAGIYKEGSYFFSGRKGVPDLCVLANGTFVGVEVKSTKGRQSVEQAMFQKLIEKSGNRYLLVRSLSALIEGMGDVVK